MDARPEGEPPVEADPTDDPSPGDGPTGPVIGGGKLRRLVAHARKVYGVGKLLAGVVDSRPRPQISTRAVATAILFCGLLRIRSFNALEPKLAERTFQRLVGVGGKEELGSADTLGRVLRATEVESAAAVSRVIVAKAERNKVFRLGWVGARRYVALDGWEPFNTFHRHCEHCLVRQVKIAQADGSTKVVEQYFHQYVVAMLIDERFDLVLDLEPLLDADRRPDRRQDAHEGEQTAAIRLLRRLKRRFRWLDVVVADALYANGPFLSVVADLKLGSIVIAKKESDEPLKEALTLWQGIAPRQIRTVDQKRADGRRGDRERHELWDCPDLTTLGTYKGPIRVVRAVVTKLDPEEGDKPRGQSTWCMLSTGKACALSAGQVLAVARGRWHIENTCFHQWVTCWKFKHVFVRDDAGLLALYWLFIAAYNLLTLHMYSQLKSYGRDRGKDVTQTISRLIDEMKDDLARLDLSPWDSS